MSDEQAGKTPNAQRPTMSIEVSMHRKRLTISHWLPIPATLSHVYPMIILLAG
jgi:hypothetical protein